MDTAQPLALAGKRSEVAHGLNGRRVKIRASNVSFYYGRFRALHDVSMTIAEHKITAMIGPSGCGKSTLLQIFNRMFDLTRGTRVTGSVKIGGGGDHEHASPAGASVPGRHGVPAGEPVPDVDL